MSVGKTKSKAVDVETCCLSAAVPAYLRFDAVEFEYGSVESCEQMKLHLQHFKNALIGSKFSIRCSIDYYDSFKSSSVFLEHFAKEVLPIINTETSQSFAFKMLVFPNLYYEFDVEGIITGIIAALPNISDLSFNFEFEMPTMPRKWRLDRMKKIRLPVNQISDWLTRKTKQKSGKKDEQNVMKERGLFIYIYSGRVWNWNYMEMSKCVEKVANNALMCIYNRLIFYQIV